jgi:hypothetical protein
MGKSIKKFITSKIINMYVQIKRYHQLSIITYEKVIIWGKNENALYIMKLSSDTQE